MRAFIRPMVVLGLAAASTVAACTGEAPPARTGSAEAGSADGGYVRPSATDVTLTSGDTIPGNPFWTRQDYEIFESTVRWARETGVDTLPVGDRVATIGERFVGTAYIPQTLDPAGPERLVVNLRAFDCVTFVESMLTLAWFVREAPDDVLERPEEARRTYEDLLTSIRYRGGERAEYPSRLHYFSEWLQDNHARGHLRLVTEALGGTPDTTPIDFMSTHRDSYRQLSDDTFFADVVAVEDRLSGVRRYVLPEDKVAEVQDSIRTGDVIAATSTVEGLDIAHTGIALWKGSVLHLMHAPLVGAEVQISERPLAERLLSISSQDGIMVGRPLERTF